MGSGFLSWRVDVFGWFGRNRAEGAAGTGVVARQPPGGVFAWPVGAVLTAVDEVVLAVPIGLFEGDRPIGEFVMGPDDMQLNIPPEGETFYIRLAPGMSVRLAKSVQACVVAEDKRRRRISVTLPPGRA